MKVVADANIAEAANAFSELGDLELVPGRDISPAHLADCQCLIVRTVTRVDADDARVGNIRDRVRRRRARDGDSVVRDRFESIIMMILMKFRAQI